MQALDLHSQPNARGEFALLPRARLRRSALLRRGGRSETFSRFRGNVYPLGRGAEIYAALQLYRFARRLGRVLRFSLRSLSQFRALFKELERKFAKVRRGKTPKRVWICDMALWGVWSLRTNRKIGILNDFYPIGVWFDGKINDASYFKTRNFLPGVVKPWRKIVDFRDGRPWGETKDGKRGPFLLLHYQGGFKFLMEEHFEGRHSDWAIFKRLLTVKTKSVPQRIAHFTRR